MSWRIGTVRLPLAPYEVKYQVTKNVMEIASYFQMPILMILGPKVPKLILKGYIAEAGKTLEDLEKDYIIPLREMVLEGMSTRILLFDEEVSNWSSATGVLAEETSQVIHGDKSMKVTLSSQALDVYRDYSTAQNFGLQDFVSLHFRGLNSGSYINIGFYNENYASKTNGYYYRFEDDSSAWKWLVIPKLAFKTIGTPTGWGQIKCIRIWSDDALSGSVYLDYIAVGVGQYLDCPYERYKGIWVVSDFQYSERGGNIAAFEYTLTLLGQNDLYRGAEP